MSVIAGIGASGFDAAATTDRISQRFQAADQDGSGDISQVEFADALAGQGIGDATAQKVFSRLDADGDGLVSQAEQRAGVASIATRLQEYTGQPGASQPTQALTSLLDAIAASAEDADTSSEAQTLLQQLQTSGPAGETVSEVLAFLNDNVRSVNVTA